MFDNNDSNNQQGYQFQPVAPQVPTPPYTPQPPNTTQHFTSPVSPALPPTDPIPGIAAPVTPASEQPGGENLMAIKQDALASLTPLVGQIEQSPEEKFKTTMMLIQASDNASLIKEAYAAANQITDSKARAQALIDVINEINYFTQKNDSKS